MDDSQAYTTVLDQSPTFGYGVQIPVTAADLGYGVQIPANATSLGYSDENADPTSLGYSEPSGHSGYGVEIPFASDHGTQPPTDQLAAHLPPTQEQYTTEDGVRMFGIHSNYEGEDLERNRTAFPQDGRGGRPNAYHITHYADEAERDQHRAYIDEQGLYHAADGTLLDSEGTSAIHQAGQGGHIYVMDEQGQNYVANATAEAQQLNQDVDETMIYQHVHHTTLAEGRPVAAAGEKYFDDGRLKTISDMSGHYYDLQNPYEATGTMQTLLSDLDAGADLSETRVHLVPKQLPADMEPPEYMQENGINMADFVPQNLPAIDTSVDQFLDATGDQQVLYAMQLSAQEYARQQLANQGPALDGEYVPDDAMVGNGVAEEDEVEALSGHVTADKYFHFDNEPAADGDLSDDEEPLDGPNS